ncbi:hypothetical protein DMENIID0001_129140 [Sergentomyia squamirostris]
MVRWHELVGKFSGNGIWFRFSEFGWDVRVCISYGKITLVCVSSTLSYPWAGVRLITNERHTLPQQPDGLFHANTTIRTPLALSSSSSSTRGESPTHTHTHSNSWKVQFRANNSSDAQVGGGETTSVSHSEPNRITNIALGVSWV